MNRFAQRRQRQLTNKQKANASTAPPRDAAVPGLAVEGRVAVLELVERERLRERPAAGRAAEPGRAQGPRHAIEAPPPPIKDRDARVADKDIQLH